MESQSAVPTVSRRATVAHFSVLTPPTAATILISEEYIQMHANCVITALTVSITTVLCFTMQITVRGAGPRRTYTVAQKDSTRDSDPQVSNDAVGLEVQRKRTRERIAEINSELAKQSEPNPDLYVDRADAYMLLHEFERAFDDYTKAIESPTRRDPIYFILQYRVFAGVGKGYYVQALKDAKELTKTSPPQANAYAICALVLARSPDAKVKDPKEAMDYAIRAATMKAETKDEVLLEKSLAAAHSANGSFREAVVHQQRAIAAAKGKATAEAKAQLEAYRAGKEYPFPFKKKAQ
jgi:tetratricopeptide (TPR) repeat protein